MILSKMVYSLAGLELQHLALSTWGLILQGLSSERGGLKVIRILT